MHTQIHLEVIFPSQTALASWQCGKRHLEKTRLVGFFKIFIYLYFFPPKIKLCLQFQCITVCTGVFQGAIAGLYSLKFLTYFILTYIFF